MDIKRSVTDRGFILLEFIDLYGEECSLQESSLASPDCVWLGCGETRMHLTQEMASDLIEELQFFVDNGGLMEEEEKTIGDEDGVKYDPLLLKFAEDFFKGGD